MSSSHSPAVAGNSTFTFFKKALLALVITAFGLAAGGALGWVAHGNTLLFAGVVLVLLFADQMTINRKDHKMSTWEAVLQSIFWIGLGLGFGAFTYYTAGATKGIEYFTGYAIEKALSVDNLFVFIVIFSFFRVPEEYRHKVLFWGIIGAKIMRFALIAAGAAIVNVVHLPLLYVLVAVVFLSLIWFGSKPAKMWHRILLYGALGAGAVYGTMLLAGPHLHSLGLFGHEANVVLMFFGVVLLGSAVKLYGAGDDDGVEPDKNPIVKFVSNHAPVHDQYVGSQFFARVQTATGQWKWMLTPLAIVLVAIEATDLMFATDSIPAIFAVSKDPFILYSSNVCAILGLRALYFMLEKGMQELHYLKKALVFVLGFIGVKLVIDPIYHLPIAWALAVVLVTITGSIILSLVFKPKAEAHEEEPKN